MARKLRVEKVGFYHVLNRGVVRGNIYLCNDDFVKFLEIMQEASDEYSFQIDSFCLMTNHYHLLLETNKENLSIIMQKINSRYSIYFNKKYKRVGPLWQGRFKSWYVYDENYLSALIRYIEFNPIKANITQKEVIPLSDYFIKHSKEQAIYNAIKDGYTGSINLTIEYLFKYGDFDEILQGFKLFGKRMMKRVCEDKLKSDKKFIQLNFMIARVFFDMDVEADCFKEVENARFEKLKLLVS